jgi:hypothetical protein
MMSPEQAKRMLYLFGVLREETITRQELSELNGLLETEPAARDYYIDYVYLCTDLCNLQAATSHNDAFLDVLQGCNSQDESCRHEEVSVLFETMKLLGEDEKKAQPVAIPAKDNELQENEITKIAATPASRKINKVSLYTAFLTTAALVMMFMYVYLNPRTSLEVATLADSIGAEWNAGISLDRGVRVATESQPIKLNKGVVELITDEGVRIIIESPAEFRFTSASEVNLNYGKIYSSVSQDGRGFIVKTPSSKIIDLGTEFGVMANMLGTTELHVFKGKTVFIGETQNHSKKVLDAIAGQALRLERSDDDVRSIALNDEAFVRSIDSGANLYWRGQKQINLADVAGQGNGFGTGKRDWGIDPASGKFGEAIARIRKSPNAFTAVTNSVFVDGVFVPDGKSQQVISSAGHVFSECPQTHGCYYSPILNTPPHFQSDLTLYLDELNYSLPQNPCIFLHSNMGITFDLRAFRQCLPGIKISRFLSQVGISNTAPGVFDADIWVLIDGQIRYKKTGVDKKGLLDDLSIDIREQDCFLTLIATEGKNTEEDVSYVRSSIGCDWVIFGRPVLILE